MRLLMRGQLGAIESHTIDDNDYAAFVGSEHTNTDIWGDENCLSPSLSRYRKAGEGQAIMKEILFKAWGGATSQA